MNLCIKLVTGIGFKNPDQIQDPHAQPKYGDRNEFHTLWDSAHLTVCDQWTKAMLW